MKSNLLFVVILTASILSACSKEKTTVPETPQIILIDDINEFNSSKDNRSLENSDPFTLNYLNLTDSIINISISYAGGCKQHTFEIIWNALLLSGNPPEISFIIKHNAHDDHCEAYLTENIEINVADLFDSEIPDALTINVLSGCDPNDSVSFGGDEYNLGFLNSDTCNVFVTATRVICGVGLYNNLWFALADSIISGDEEIQFRNYLQPVSISSTISGFIPVEGKKYKIGGIIEKDNEYANVPVCLAYSGPSVPIRIMCVTEVSD